MSWWRKRGLLRICEKNGVPAILHIHSGKFDVFCRSFAGKSIKRSLSSENVTVIVLEDRWRTRLSPWLPPNTYVVRNFTEIEPRDVRRVLGSKISLLMLSRSSHIKGVNLAMDVVDKLTEFEFDVSLIVTGDRGKLPISRLNDGKVSFKGWVSEEEKRVLMDQADFLLSPSKFEGSSMTVIESMMFGLPCIVSMASSETVGLDQLVVNDFEPKSWADRIAYLHEQETYDMLVHEIRRRSTRFDPKENKKVLSSVYSDIIGSGKS